MAFGIQLPITTDSISGFTNINDFKTLIKANFKMLILTNPGKVIRSPQFGVGAATFLFENRGTGVGPRLKNKIIQQASIYLPVIEVKDVIINEETEDSNAIHVTIKYVVPNLGIQDLLEFTI
tara:strand:+ start:8563 stop:8928 length:366 start_codon:yes stop_codon:yes gene_type:complete